MVAAIEFLTRPATVANNPSLLGQVLFPGYVGEAETITTTSNADGSITVHYATSGITDHIVTNADGSITETFTGPSFNHVRTTTVAGNVVTEVIT